MDNDFERNQETVETINEHCGKDIASYNARSVKLIYQDLGSKHEQESVFSKMHALGYRLNRFGEFHSGVEFAEFVTFE